MDTTHANPLEILAVLLVSLGLLLFKEGAYLHDVFFLAGISAGIASIVIILRAKTKSPKGKH